MVLIVDKMAENVAKAVKKYFIRLIILQLHMLCFFYEQ